MLPIPNRVVPQEGEFHLKTIKVITCGTDAILEAEKLGKKLSLPIQISDAVPDSIHLELSADLKNPEAYVLEIRPTGVKISASGLAGLFYGCITLLQAGSSCAVITDKPRFAWRGSHLDVSRHFMPFEWLKKYLDLLALHKMNILHLHLTDDQGWRLEIQKYPRLTEIGAYRKQTRVGHELSEHKSFDCLPHGGFYSQAQMKELVAYALERHITIVPEIEMPGHATAALAAYPKFGNTKQAPEVAPNWGVFESVFSPEESTFGF